MPGVVGVPGLDPDGTRVIADQLVGVVPPVLVVSIPFRQVVEPLLHDRPEGRKPHGGQAEGEQIRGCGVGRGLGRIWQPVGRSEAGMRQAHPRRGRVQARDEGSQARAVGVSERIRRISARRKQQGLEQLLRGQLVARTQRRALPAVLPDVGERRLRHPDLPVQVAAFEDHQGGHHLGDTGHGSLGVQAATPQHLAGGRVGQNRSLGLHALRRAGHPDQRASGRVAGSGPGRGRWRPVRERRGGPARRPGTRSGVRDRPRGDATTDDGGSRGHRDDPCRQPHGVVDSRYHRSVGITSGVWRTTFAATLYRPRSAPSWR